MKDANGEKKPSRAGEVAFSVGLSAVMLLIALALTWGAFFEKGHESESLGVPGYLLITVVWALAIAPFVALVPRVGRLAGWISGAAGVVFGLFFVSVVLREIWTRPAGAPIPPGRATFLSLLILVFAFGLALFRSSRRAGAAPVERESMGIITLWPLMLVVKAPLAAVGLFAIATGLIYLGESLGARSGHPIAGCALATALIAGLLAAPALIQRARR